jgi:hypothetical protein
MPPGATRVQIVGPDGASCCCTRIESPEVKQNILRRQDAQVRDRPKVGCGTYAANWTCWLGQLLTALTRDEPSHWPQGT